MRCVEFWKLTARYYFYSKFDPHFNFWCAVFFRGTLLPPRSIDVAKIVEVKPSKAQLTMNDWYKRGEDQRAKIKVQSILLSGASSDSEGESHWKWITTAEKSVRKMSEQFQLSHRRDVWARQTLFPAVPGQFGFGHDMAPVRIQHYRNHIRNTTNTTKKRERKWMSENKLKPIERTAYFGSLENTIHKEPLSEGTKVVASQLKSRVKTNQPRIESHHARYWYPSLQLATYINDASGRPINILRNLQAQGRLVDVMKRLHFFRNEFGLLVFEDQETAGFVLVLELLEGLYDGIRMRPDGAGYLSVVSGMESPIVSGFSADCAYLADYYPVHRNGRLSLYVANSTWVQFNTALADCVEALPSNMVSETLAYYLRIDKPTVNLEDELRIVLRTALADGYEAGFAAYDAAVSPPMQLLGRVMDTAVRAGGGRPAGTANRERTAAQKTRTYLGYTRHDVWFHIECKTCEKRAAAIRNSIKRSRTGNVTGCQLYTNYEKDTAHGIRNKKLPKAPRTLWPTTTPARIRINEALLPKIKDAHKVICKKARLNVVKITARGDRTKMVLNPSVNKPYYDAVMEGFPALSKDDERFLEQEEDKDPVMCTAVDLGGDVAGDDLLADE
ncbi:unnamed protein product [Amoebophrya sp. A25]|nr:unnamed protein product [Amoebophrya sp. A25]|eukprot:GSA25T00022839001.1